MQPPLGFWDPLGLSKDGTEFDFNRRREVVHITQRAFVRRPLEPKVRLQGYGYKPFCSHSSRCLAVLVWQYFEEAFCATKVRLKWYGFKGFPSHSSHCSGGLFPQYSGVSPRRPLKDPLLTWPLWFLSGAEKEPQNQIIARTVPKNFLKNSKGLLGRCPVKQGFWGKSHQKVHLNVRQNLCHTQFLCGTFSVPNFSTRRCPSYPFYFFKRAPGTLSSWLVTENPSREVATKDHFTSKPRKGTSQT